MSKQSSIEWLESAMNRIMEKNNIEVEKIIWEQAKAMHKEEIEEAHYDGSIITLLNPDGDILKLSEQYYHETFGGQDNE